jgi:hypothetical protein
LRERSRARFHLARTRVARAGLHLARAERHKFAPDRSIAALHRFTGFDLRFTERRRQPAQENSANQTNTSLIFKFFLGDNP